MLQENGGGSKVEDAQTQLVSEDLIDTQCQLVIMKMYEQVDESLDKLHQQLQQHFHQVETLHNEGKCHESIREQRLNQDIREIHQSIQEVQEAGKGSEELEQLMDVHRKELESKLAIMKNELQKCK